MLSARPARVPSPPCQEEETAIASIPHPTTPKLTIGVDTHLDVHVAHAADQLGHRVATCSVPTTPAGYAQLLGWARRLGQPLAWGWKAPAATAPAWPASLPPTGRWWWRSTGPDRAAGRRQGRSDPLDAQAASRAVQAGQATVTPKAGSGQVEMIRSLRVARLTAMRSRTQAVNALRALLVTAPAELREQLRARSRTRLARRR